MDASLVGIAIGMVVIIVVAYRWAMAKGTDKFWELMRTTNDLNGTNFGTTRANVHTVVGTHNPIMAFDHKNQKIAFATKNGKSVEVLDYSFVRSWKVTWTESTRTGGGPSMTGYRVSSRTSQSMIVMEIATNDLKRPIVKLRMPSMAYAEQANARLNILLNQ